MIFMIEQEEHLERIARIGMLISILYILFFIITFTEHCGKTGGTDGQNPGVGSNPVMMGKFANIR